MIVVSLSKFVNLTSLSVTRSGLVLQTKRSTSLNRISAQRGLGKPKIPEEMAGIATDSHFSFTALLRVD